MIIIIHPLYIIRRVSVFHHCIEHYIFVLLVFVYYVYNNYIYIYIYIYIYNYIYILYYIQLIFINLFF